MSLLSKSEIQFLKRQKQVTKSYEYKLKSIIKKKVTSFLDVELNLLSPLLQTILTENSKSMSPLNATNPRMNPSRSTLTASRK